MIYLLIVSLIWAFSFGLIKDNLANLDSNFVSCVRMFISLIVFLPFLRLKNIELKLAVKLTIIGMIQYGLMYVTYIYSYQFLKAYQVAIFTIFTPLYVTLINDITQRRFHKMFLATALFAIIGTAIIVNKQIDQGDLRLGFLVIQISNICFAFGQVAYKKVMRGHSNIKDVNIFGLLYLGAFILTLVTTNITTKFQILYISIKQLLTLIYLGSIASGLCFFLWNYGARKTNIGALAIFNNMKIPLAVICSILIFHEDANIYRLLLGGIIILSALYINERFLGKM